MMERSRAYRFFHDKEEWIAIKPTEPLNLDHIETVSGSKDEFYIDWELADRRKMRVRQRRLFFALINDIVQWSVMPQEYVKDMFYLQYSAYTGKEISLADNSKTSVSDVNTLIDLVIDFMFEWNVPFKEGYKQLPREEQYFIYQCCRHRRCLVCGDYADIHHLDTVGMGMNRDHIDHTQKHVMPLCRTHHENYHQLGAEKFSELYHVPVNGIKLDAEILKKLGVKGNYKSQ